MRFPGRLVAAATIAAVTALPVATTVLPADAASKSYHYKNCTALHKDFEHGVGRSGAKDKHTKSSKAVTNFKRSTTIYKAAVKYNKDLDRDRDGIACEKH